jgi:uncharacterized membrane protein HdeD (DUF308 family)
MSGQEASVNTHHDLWWLWILRAISTAMFAMIAIAYPPLTSTLAVYLYGAYVKLDGFVLIGLNTNGNVRQPWLLVAGIVAIASGVTILMWPFAGSDALVLTLATLAIARGALEAVPPILDGRLMWERRLRIVVATLIVAFGFVLVAHEPLNLRIMIGAFALFASLTSVSQLAIGFAQRTRHLEQPKPRKRKSTRARQPVSGAPISCG